MKTPLAASESAIIIKHYGATSLATRVNGALTKAGFGDAPVSWEDLVALDQFHVRGIVATRELAAGMHLTPDATILDVGCGIGGASRFLAATYNSHVTGIDLTPSFVEAARLKSESSKDLFIFGSANLSDTLTRRGLIDEYGICMVPVVLGGGIPLFKPSAERLPLHLLESRPLASGGVILRYEPDRSGAP